MHWTDRLANAASVASAGLLAVIEGQPRKQTDKKMKI